MQINMPIYFVFGFRDFCANVGIVMVDLIELPVQDRDELPASGREAAICELVCRNCGDGVSFQQTRCMTCGELSPRYQA
jgi:hypothetical protein